MTDKGNFIVNGNTRVIDEFRVGKFNDYYLQ